MTIMILLLLFVCHHVESKAFMDGFIPSAILHFLVHIHFHLLDVKRIKSFIRFEFLVMFRYSETETNLFVAVCKMAVLIALNTVADTLYEKILEHFFHT